MDETEQGGEFSFEPGICNRVPGRTAAEANLNGAPCGFKATGDAAWDSDSEDYAMFTDAGNAQVAAMVKTARVMTKTKPEADVMAWLVSEKFRLANSPDVNPRRSGRPDPCTGYGECTDTMVRETIGYALDEAWNTAYGCSFDDRSWRVAGLG
jgi:hypothetical protein